MCAASEGAERDRIGRNGGKGRKGGEERRKGEGGKERIEIEGKGRGKRKIVGGEEMRFTVCGGWIECKGFR